MAKTKNIGLNLTEDDSTKFSDWRKSIDGNGTGSEKSNMQIIDEAIGDINADMTDYEERISTLESGGEMPDMSDYVKFTEYATESKAGVVKPYKPYCFNVNSNGIPNAEALTAKEYSSASVSAFIGKGTLENIKYTYVKEGITTNTETLTDEEKASACDWLGVTDLIAELRAEIEALKNG